MANTLELYSCSSGTLIVIPVDNKHISLHLKKLVFINHSKFINISVVNKFYLDFLYCLFLNKGSKLPNQLGLSNKKFEFV